MQQDTVSAISEIASGITTLVGLRRRWLGVGVAILTVTTTPQGTAARAKAAFLLPGSINDQSWNAQGHQAVERLASIGWDVAYTENVRATDMVESMRDYSRRKYDVVVGHSGRFLPAAQRVAPEFPNTLFIIGSGAAGSGTNVASIEYDNTQFGYLLGVLAARMSKTNKIGAVSSLEGLPTKESAAPCFRSFSLGMLSAPVVKLSDAAEKGQECHNQTVARMGRSAMRGADRHAAHVT